VPGVTNHQFDLGHLQQAQAAAASMSAALPSHPAAITVIHNASTHHEDSVRFSLQFYALLPLAKIL